MIRAIFWDNDGVLVDTERLYCDATRRVLASAGIELPLERYVELFMVQSTGAWPLCAERGLSDSAIEELRQQRDAVYRQALGLHALAITGVADVLEALHGRYVMGMVTSSIRSDVDLQHRSTGLLRFFDFVLTGDDYTNFKPHPEPYLTAVQRSGCAPDECLVIEDTERGLASAKAAGLTCYVIPTELTRSASFARADRVLGSVGELLEVL